jgi:hypothetical protein
MWGYLLVGGCLAGLLVLVIAGAIMRGGKSLR